MQIIRDYIAARIAVEDRAYATPCWIWQGRHRRDGYGRADIAGRKFQAHRVSYEAHRSDIPAGLELDHLCCVSNCVNPEHLEPVTGAENLLRKTLRCGHVVGGKASSPARRSHCTNGHEYADFTTAISASGRRRCLLCAPIRPAPATHCRNGHEYTPEGVRFRKDGTRRCLVCRKRELEANARRRRVKGAAARKTGGVGAASNSGLTQQGMSLTHPERGSTA